MAVKKSSVIKKKSTNVKKKKFSPGLKNKPKFSLVMLSILVVALAIPGIYLIYNSRAATTVAGDPEPALEPEVSAGVTAPDDTTELAKMGAGPLAAKETVNNNAFGTSTPWRTSTDKNTYNNALFWKGASTASKSSCVLGTFSATSKKALIVNQHYVQFKNTGSNANYFILIPDYQINGGSPRYTNLERHIPGFYTKTNNAKYKFVADSKSNSQGYTNYTARLSGYYLYKTQTMIAPATGTTPAKWQYKLYRIKCGAKKVTNIYAPKAVDGEALKNKAVSQIGTKEDPSGSNCGAKVKQYEAAGGLSCGQPWCAAFASWVYTNTNFKIQNKPALKEPGAGQMQARLENSAFKRYVVVKQVKCGNYDFQPGDILIRHPWQDDGHVGMVRSYSGGVLKTIEGNASDMVKQNVYKGSEICQNWQFYGDWRKWN
ncbi:MAG: CHAP domain-containing protein [Patescibacteria group bacterium]|jgi:hypothetical protein|nr:CHAP domain-containing protein [Patescibacteria group bacterium]